MLHVTLPDSKSPRRLVFYLAMEEYLAQHCTCDMLFTWRVEPTVIFGRHQVMADEVNIDFCRANGIQMYRRKSGGGCVYADRGNIMVSYITPDVHADKVFQWYLDTMSGVLRSMGFAAAKSEHNDVLIADRKVSGNACYALPTGTIVHGTMLYDVDFAALQQAITPSREKLSKHGVQSVRQRVVNIKELLDEQSPWRTVEAFDDALVAAFCDETICLDDAQLADISAIEQTYLQPDFISGKD